MSDLEKKGVEGEAAPAQSPAPPDIPGFRLVSEIDRGAMGVVWEGVQLSLNRKVAVSRFCRTLSTLMISGVPIISALEIVKNVVGNAVIQDSVQTAIENITEGQSIAAPLKASEQFPPMATITPTTS